MKNITFVKLDGNFDRFDILYNWCQNSFVYEWFEQRKLSFDEVKTKYLKKIRDNDQNLFLINYANKPIGYIQYYKFNYSNNSSIKKCDNIYEYDIFIGEKDYIGKGYGTIAIKKINEYIFEKEKCDSIILRPFSRNIRAIKAYKKCGFKIIDEYLGKDTLNRDEFITVLILKNNQLNLN